MRRNTLLLNVILIAALLVSGCSIDIHKTQEQSQPASSNTNGDNIANTNSNANDGLSFFYGVFQLQVPGVSYTTDNEATNTRTITTSTGVQAGGIKINSDGTYIWNSTWDDKIINGKWEATGDSDYPIELLEGEEGKDWSVGKSDQTGSDIIVWDGSIWKVGMRVK